MESGVEMVIRMGSVLISIVRYSLELSVRPGSESTARHIRIERGIVKTLISNCREVENNYLQKQAAGVDGPGRRARWRGAGG
ncbi:hypothetical protein EVAR_19958_1 [Eumeta japonica]|uniref:Uncharacterized protein n=1 Tax=Eumeta variegata TaxID=151549 RepID=A0A4C1YKZ6_EUMVA|nr:hypothetical protein EVAR_19958_1 [Eumeta japonica]